MEVFGVVVVVVVRQHDDDGRAGGGKGGEAVEVGGFKREVGVCEDGVGEV